MGKQRLVDDPNINPKSWQLPDHPSTIHPVGTSVKAHLTAVLLALFVVFLWATSWIFIKIGLQDIPPLIFAGLRYFLAFICLLMVVLLSKSKQELKGLDKRAVGSLLVLGLLLYAATQGAIFVALSYLPAVTVNLLWSFSTIIITLLGIAVLSEKPSPMQSTGILIALVGAFIYFSPLIIPNKQILGVIVAIMGVFANAVSSILGRNINRSAAQHPLIVTGVSMGIGSVVLLLTGLWVEGIPLISLKGWAIILWLAVVNTALAFTLWNHTLRTLTAMESSIINGTMLIWIPILAILFLGEQITGKQIGGLIIVGIGTLIVQLRRLPFTRRDAT